LREDPPVYNASTVASRITKVMDQLLLLSEAPVSSLEGRVNTGKPSDSMPRQREREPNVRESLLNWGLGRLSVACDEIELAIDRERFRPPLETGTLRERILRKPPDWSDGKVAESLGCSREYVCKVRASKKRRAAVA
jgi:hypothetical protein